jgi:hypothetical protein
MLTQTFRLLGLILAACTFGLAFCHVVELPAKMTLSGPEYMTTLRLYQLFGPVGSVTEPGAIVATIVLAFLVRRQRRALALTVAAAVLLATALLVWFAVVNPVNARWAAAAPGQVPADWMALRDRWEYGHAAHAAILFLGLVSLILSVLVQEEPTAARGRVHSGVSWPRRRRVA